MKWPANAKAHKVSKQIFDSRLDGIPDKPALKTKTETIAEYLRRGGVVKRLKPLRRV